MSERDAITDADVAAYRAQSRAVGRKPRLGGFALVILGALLSYFAAKAGAAGPAMQWIGYASLAEVKNSVTALTIDGVAPTEATVKDGTYKIQRPFVLVTKEGTALSETAQKFFDFATSADAASIISAAGAVPVA